MKGFGYKSSEIESFLRPIGYNFFALYSRDWIAVDTIGGLDGINVVCAPEAFVSQ